MMQSYICPVALRLLHKKNPPVNKEYGRSCEETRRLE